MGLGASCAARGTHCEGGFWHQRESRPELKDGTVAVGGGKGWDGLGHIVKLAVTDCLYIPLQLFTLVCSEDIIEIVAAGVLRVHTREC